MKNLLLVLVATILLSGNFYGQKISKENARESMAQTMVSFTNSLKPIFSETAPQSFEDFLKVLYPNSENPGISKDAKNFIRDSYMYLKSNTSDSKILKEYDGVSLAKMVKPIVDKNRSGTILIDLEKLLTGTGPYNPEIQQRAAGGCGCKWFQIGCHLRCILGDEIFDLLIMILPLLL